MRLRNAFLAAAAVASLLMAPAAARWLDRHVWHETLKDAVANLRGDDDWAGAAPLLPKPDYRWLHASRRPVLVAHALGAAGGAGQNTLAALERSRQVGIDLLEVDLWLDAEGRIRCHHGPPAPPPFEPGHCTLDAALDSIGTQDAWLVLDIKDNFARTGDAVVRAVLAHPDRAAKLIFQLYRPNDVAAFGRWRDQVPLPGPILTAYAARHSLNHLAAQAARIGIEALAAPIERTPALQTLPPGVTLLLHPVGSVEAVEHANRLSAGMYLSSVLVPEIRR